MGSVAGTVSAPTFCRATASRCRTAAIRFSTLYHDGGTLYVDLPQDRAGSMRRLLVLSAVIPSLASAQARHVPTVDELLNLRSVSSAQLSPNASWVAYLVTETDWKNDNFV